MSPRPDKTLHVARTKKRTKSWPNHEKPATADKGRKERLHPPELTKEEKKYQQQNGRGNGPQTKGGKPRELGALQENRPLT